MAAGRVGRRHREDGDDVSLGQPPNFLLQVFDGAHVSRVGDVRMSNSAALMRDIIVPAARAAQAPGAWRR
jgi:hypothetical protein